MWAKIAISSHNTNGVIVPVFNEPVGNLGAVLDTNMNMSANVSKVTKSANYKFRNTGKMIKCLHTSSAKRAIGDITP